MNATPDRVNLNERQREQIRDAALVDLEHDDSLRTSMAALFATTYNPATNVPNVNDFLVRFTNVNRLIDGWVAAVYPDPFEANIARQAIHNEAVGIIKNVATERRTEYQTKNTSFESAINTTVASLRTVRQTLITEWPRLTAVHGALPMANYNALVAALNVGREHFMGEAAPPAGGAPVTNYAEIRTRILEPIQNAFRNLEGDVSPVHIAIPAGGTTPTIDAAIAAQSAILGLDINFSDFSRNAQAALENYRGDQGTINNLTGAPGFLERVSQRLVRPALDVVADQETRYKNLQFNETGNSGHGNTNYPYHAFLPVTNPLSQSGYVAGPMPASDSDINRYYGWVLGNRNGLSEDAKNAVDANARSTVEYHIDYTEIQNHLNAILATRGITGQLSPSTIRTLGPEAVEAYINDYAYYVDGAHGFADTDSARDARLKLLAWHYDIAPGQNMNDQIYARISQQLLENLGHVTDKAERKEITQETVDDYAKFYQGKFIRSGLRRNARREVFTARKEEIYANLADEYEGKQITSTELQKRLKADLVKEVMRGRYEIIEKIASQREIDDDAGIFKRLGGKIESIRRKLTANPVKMFFGNLAVGGGAVAAGAFIPMLPFSAPALALSGLVGLSARGATMSLMDGARAKLSRARGNRTVGNASTRRNAATGVRGPVHAPNARKAQKSLIKQISLGHDVDADFDFNNKTGEFSIQSETYTGQLERSTALWKAESQQVEAVVDAQIRAALAPGGSKNPMSVVVNSLNALYGNGGLEDTFMKKLEKEMINRRAMLKINQAAALGMAFTGATLFTVSI